MRKMVPATIALPEDLLAAVDRSVREGLAASRSAWIADALRRQLAAHERAAVDAAFAEMATDGGYGHEAEVIHSEFASASWEAFRLGEPGR